MKKQNEPIIAEGVENGKVISEENKPKKKKGLKVALWILGIILFLIIFAYIAVTVLIHMGKKQLIGYDNVKVDVPEFVDLKENDGKTVVYKGQKYVLNENITSILGMGVDKAEFEEDKADSYGTNGQADSLFVIALDVQTGKIKALAISREAMVDIDVYSQSGNYTGSEKRQICLAYAYGDGREFSCENVVKSAERYIYGLPINSYFAIDFASVSAVNDAVGGITLNSIGDFDFTSGKSIKNGQGLTLKGSEALQYVRSRSQTDVDANVKRSQRQVQYMKAFTAKLLSQTRNDISTPLNIYNAVSADNHLITDINAAKVSFLTQCAVKNISSTDIEFISIDGETKLGEDNHAEFYVDETKLFEAILDIFYNKA